MKSALCTLWSFFRRGFIAYIGAKLVVFPVFLYVSLLGLRYHGHLKAEMWEFVMVLLLLATPFWAAYFSRSLLRSPHLERFRQELVGGASAQP